MITASISSTEACLVEGGDPLTEVASRQTITARCGKCDLCAEDPENGYLPARHIQRIEFPDSRELHRQRRRQRSCQPFTNDVARSSHTPLPEQAPSTSCTPPPGKHTCRLSPSLPSCWFASQLDDHCSRIERLARPCPNEAPQSSRVSAPRAAWAGRGASATSSLQGGETTRASSSSAASETRRALSYDRSWQCRASVTVRHPEGGCLH